MSVLPNSDSRFLITACWDGKNRRVRFRSNDYEQIRFFYDWCLRHEPETNPQIEDKDGWILC